MMRLSKVFIVAVCLLFSVVSLAAPWAEHQKDIEDLERKISRHEEEMETLVERKKSTRDRSRIEETLQRIVTIHSELITLRKGMDSARAHIQAKHPDKTNVLDDYDSRSLKANQGSKKYRTSALSSKLDQLLIKVQAKFSTFMKDDMSQERLVVEKVVQKKRKKKREREADVYLRRRSKVKLTK